MQIINALFSNYTQHRWQDIGHFRQANEVMLAAGPVYPHDEVEFQYYQETLDIDIEYIIFLRTYADTLFGYTFCSLGALTFMNTIFHVHVYLK